MNRRKTFKDLYVAGAVGLVLAAAVYRGVFAFFFGPGGDEAVYWEFSRRLDLCYVDHPPLIGWTYYLIRQVTGDALWGWRLAASAFMIATNWISFLTASLLFSKRVAFWVVLLQVVSPFLCVGLGTLLIPETLLALWIYLAIYFFARFIKDGRRFWFYPLGIVIGLGLLSKVPALLIPFAIFLFLCLSPSHRHWLKRKEPWMMWMLALVIYSPVIYWNVSHDWASLNFIQERSDANAYGHKPGWTLLWQSLIAQAGYHSPLLFVGLWAAICVAGYRGLVHKDTRFLLLFCFGAPVMVAFQVVASFRYTLPHWPTGGYLAAYIALPAAWLIPSWMSRSSPSKEESTLPEQFQQRRRTRTLNRVLIFGTISFAILECLIAPALLLYPLKTRFYACLTNTVGAPPKTIDPMAVVEGRAEEIRQRILELRNDYKARTGNDLVPLSSHHLLASVMNYVMREDSCEVICLHGQAHQYDWWYSDEDLKGKSVLYFSSELTADHLDRPSRPEDYYVFDHCTALPPTDIVRYGVTINRAHFWLCEGYRGPVTPGNSKSTAETTQTSEFQ